MPFTYVPLSQVLTDPGQHSSREGQVPLLVPALAVEPSLLTFGSAATGTVSPVQEVTLTNNTDQVLVINSVTEQGPFQVTHNCPAELPAGASCVISAKFAPTSVGGLSGGIYVSTGSGLTEQKFIQLAGTGLANATNVVAS